MQSYRVVAVGDRIANAVRKTLRSPDQGHPAHTEAATGYGPCRQCLRTFTVGSERGILFSYDPFYGKENLPLPGPVFIHENDCYDFLIEKTSEEKGLDESKESNGAGSHE
jgi:Protein of unknown function (DUF1203)